MISGRVSVPKVLKCGFRKKAFIMNAPQLSIFVITFGWVQQQTHPKVMTDMLN